MDDAAQLLTTGAAPEAFKYKSFVVAEPLPSDAWRAAQAWLAAAAAALPAANCFFAAQGGGPASFSARAVAPDATAYPHRGVLLTVQYGCSWPPTPAADAAALALVARAGAALAAWSGEGQYINYLDAAQPDALAGYYGANLDRLRQVKSLYDPGAFFEPAFAAILPAEAGAPAPAPVPAGAAGPEPAPAEPSQAAEVIGASSAAADVPGSTLVASVWQYCLLLLLLSCG